MVPLRLTPMGIALVVLAACTIRDPLGDATGAQGTTSTSTSATPSTSSGTANPTGDMPSSTDSTTSATTTDSSTAATLDVTTFCPSVCSSAVAEYSIAPIALVFVLDKSNTMDLKPDGFWDHDADDLDLDGVSDLDPNQPATPEVSRWESLHRVVEQTLVTFDGSLHAGLSLFPSLSATNDFDPQSACPVEDPLEVAVGPMHAQAILAALPPAVGGAIDGGSPASPAIAAPVSALAASDPVHPRHIIYITDGAANCDGDGLAAFETYDESLHDRVAQALALDAITSHIVGIEIADLTSPVAQDGQPDAVNNHDRLNELALQGGAPGPGLEKFFNATDEDQLRAALEQIVRAALPCTVTLDFVPESPAERVEVWVGDINYGEREVTDCATEDGWHHIDQRQSIELCGAACRDFHAAGTMSVNYECVGGGC